MIKKAMNTPAIETTFNIILIRVEEVTFRIKSLKEIKQINSTGKEQTKPKATSKGIKLKVSGLGINPE